MSTRCLIVGSILLLQFVLETKALDELRKFNLRDPEAVCNDNSRAVVYVENFDAIKRSTKKWIIFFESGGLCTSKADCNKRYKNKNSTVLMSSKTLPDRATGRDLLSSSETENPVFYNYIHVVVPYCSSDLWLGESTSLNRPFDFKDNPSEDNFSFRGKRIFRSVFSDLKSNLTSADEIVVSGSSAGGIGVLNHAEWLSKDFFAQSRAKLLFIIDSAWFINFQDGFKSRVKPEFAELVNISSSACKDFSYGYSCCLSAQCLVSRGYLPSDKPIAFVFSLYDIYMFADVLKRLENEGKNAEDNVADFISVVSMYGGAMNESLELSRSRGGNASFFVPACFQHTYFSTSSLWEEDGVLHPLIEVTRGTGKFSHRIKSGTWASTEITKGDDEISIQDFLSSWIKSGHKPQKVIDSCIGAHCNPTCPDKIVFLDAGEVWHKTTEAVIIGLSLVITVLCGGLKAIFVCYYSYLTKRQGKYLNDSETSQARKELPLCKSDEAVSIACLFLNYEVDLTKKKKRTKPDHEAENNGNSIKGDRNSKISLQESLLDEESSSDLQEDETDVSFELPNDNGKETGSVNSRQERQPGSFRSMNGSSTLESRAGSNIPLLQSNHGDGHNGSLSRPVPISKDATDCSQKEDDASTKRILKGVSAYFNTGELVAIMGPSGCGKTTLLDLLTGRRRHGHIEGQVYINGVGLGRVQEWYACKVGYVLQLAVPYYEELTVRQNLFFVAHMRLPKGTSASDKCERVEQIIAETGLTQMADTVIGGSVGPGLSGGQKRRLCVALQLINMPSVLFLDEPTSGLDASSSLELLNHLNLVAESGRLVILTIHQPRLEIFHLFHKILFLCDGQVAYYGEPSMAPEIFIKAYARATTEEYQMSEEAPKIDAKNPADTIMDLLNCPEARRAILDYYQRSGEPQAVQEAIMTSQEKARKTVSMETMSKIVCGAGSFNRIFVLEGRTSEKQTLGQLLYFPLIFFTFGIIVGTVYWQAEERDGILLMSAYCVYCCASPLFLSSVLMAHLNKALDIFHLERADGCGRSLENVVQTFVRTTAMCILPVILCSVMSYFMVMKSYDLWKLVFVTIISLVLNQTWIAVYMMVICAQPRIAHRICPMVSAIGGFAGGFLVPRPQMPVVYNLLFYINPQFYGYAAITKVLLQNVRLECAYESTLSCISTDGNAVLTRFGLISVNPYEHLVIMLVMMVLSLLLSWLFLEAKYFNLRCFSKTPPTFSVEPPDLEEEKVEVLVKSMDETPVKEDKDVVEFQMETPEVCRINPYSSSRRSAKSKLGLISKNEGFHSVKLPLRMPRSETPDMNSNAEQSTDGEVEDTIRRRNRVTSVSEQELWKYTKQHLEERKVNFEKRMSNVQNLARKYTIKHSQSVRKRAMKKPNAVPRRSTLASSAFSEAKRQQELTLKRSADLEDGCKKSLFLEQPETESAIARANRKSEDFLRGIKVPETARKSGEMSKITEDDESSSESSACVELKQETKQEKNSEEVGQHEKGSEKQVDTSESVRGDGEKLLDDKTDTSLQNAAKKKDEERPAKRVSILELTDSLDV